MAAHLSKREALSLVKQYAKAMELELSEPEQEKIAHYLQLQEKNLSANQTTLVPEDTEVIAKLKKMLTG